MPKPLLAAENDYSSLLERVSAQPELSVAVVIPVYNRTDLLQRTVAGLLTQSYPSNLLRVIVADDGSDEDVAGALSGPSEILDLEIVTREHRGYGAGQARNLGAAAAAEADILVFFDADCIPDKDAVWRHAAWHHLADALVVVGSRHHVDTSELTTGEVGENPGLLRSLGFETEPERLDDWESKEHRTVLHRRTGSLRFGDEAFRSLVSSNFSVPAAAFRAVGGFSEQFTRWGGEDTELGWRLWNEGAFFIDEPRAVVYHQTQTDAGPQGWRVDQRQSNDGLIQTKIPHRFYRTEERTINQAPKVSVLVHAPDFDRLPELIGQILDQILGDLEIILIDPRSELTAFMERRSGDPRFHVADSLEAGIRKASGEFVAFVHGWTALDRRLLSRSVAAMERRPRHGLVKSAYGIRRENATDVYRAQSDLILLDEAWADGAPLFGLTRRRDLMKALGSGLDAIEAWDWVDQTLEATHHGSPLVWLPAPSPSHSRPESLQPRRSLRTELRTDLRAGGRRALSAPFRALRSKVTGSQFRTAPLASLPPPPKPGPSDATLVVRYVGWTGRSNLGDEAMFDAVSRELFDWADIQVEGDTGDLLMLGGGTLINRGYLRHIRPLDSPRRERVAFGTGVANPEYWGEPKEPTSEWIAFLESCAFVGVRGPLSAELLDRWGMRRPVEVIGDPALTLRSSPGATAVDGRVVVCPAWTRGLLWGGSDHDVVDAFAALVRSLREKGHDVWALSAFPADDTHIIDMMRRAGAPDLPYMAAHDDPQAALDLLATAQLVVAERLHGAVLAAAAGVVPVMVEYRPKLRDFAQSIDLSDLIIKTDVLSGDALIALADTAFSNRIALAARMNPRVDEFRSRQRTAAKHIHSLFVQ
ncbi:MAG: glycosyltransferase [Acidimicrobiia bacterium]